LQLKAEIKTYFFPSGFKETVNILTAPVRIQQARRISKAKCLFSEMAGSRAVQTFAAGLKNTIPAA